MVYRDFKLAYAREATYGSTGIVDTNATAYLLGVHGETGVHPAFQMSLEHRGVAVNEQELPTGEAWKDDLDGTGMYPTGLQNGILLQMVMGGSSTVGEDPYTHTIGPPAAVAGVLPELPSFTIQHEAFGSSADWAIQYLGTKVSQLLLMCDFEKKRLKAKVDVIAQKAEKVAFTLTNTPDLPPTKNEASYKFVNLVRTWDVDGTPLQLDSLTHMEFLISPDFEQERAPKWDSVSDEYTGQYLRSLIESPMKRYELKFRYAPESSVIWEAFLKRTGTENMLFKWTRSVNDYIQMTLSNCFITRHPIENPVRKSDDVEVTIVPLNVEFEVKDSIAASHYGE